MTPAVSEPRAGLTTAVALLGRPWTLLIIDALAERPLRFGQLVAALPGISTNLLTERLRLLSQAGVITRAPTETASTYALSARGRRLEPVLAHLADWGEDLEGAP